MLNPANLIQSALLPSRTTSSKTLEKNGESSCSDKSEEANFLASSHHSTLDRLYAWEKKLYDEVKVGYMAFPNIDRTKLLQSIMRIM